jgi:hypothetical protein
MFDETRLTQQTYYQESSTAAGIRLSHLCVVIVIDSFIKMRLEIRYRDRAAFNVIAPKVRITMSCFESENNNELLRK